MRRHILAVISDPHLSASRQYTHPAWHTAVALAREAQAERLIVPGDLVLDACDDRDDREHAAEMLRETGLPVHAVPGNHDVGDNVPEPWMGEAVSEDRLQAWRDVHGPDRFALDVGRFRLVGLNSQLFGTGFEAEHQQWVWAQEAAGKKERPMILFLHKPLQTGRRGTPDAVPSGYAHALLEMLRPAPSRMIVSGHLHQHRIVASAGFVHVWTPSAAFVGLDHQLGPAFRRAPGVLILQLEGDDVTFSVRDVPASAAVDPSALSRLHRGSARQWPPVRHVDR